MVQPAGPAATPQWRTIQTPEGTRKGRRIRPPQNVNDSAPRVIIEQPPALPLTPPHRNNTGKTPNLRAASDPGSAGLHTCQGDSPVRSRSNSPAPPDANSNHGSYYTFSDCWQAFVQILKNILYYLAFPFRALYNLF